MYFVFLGYPMDLFSKAAQYGAYGLLMDKILFLNMNE